MPDAKQLLQAVAERYATLDAYSDTGRVITRFLRPNEEGEPRVTVKPFITRFQRRDELDHLYFEYRATDHPMAQPAEDVLMEDLPQRYLVWCNGTAVRSWWSLRPKQAEMPESIGLALAGATGVSGGSAYIIPSLLGVDDVGPYKLVGDEEPRTTGAEEVDGRKCWIVEAESGVRIWIDAESNVVRRLFERMVLTDVIAESTTHYAPNLDPAFPDGAFDFTPPPAGD